MGRWDFWEDDSEKQQTPPEPKKSWTLSDAFKTAEGAAKSAASAAGTVIEYTSPPVLFIELAHRRWQRRNNSSPPPPPVPREAVVPNNAPSAVAPPGPAPRTPNITNSNITIANMDFPAWFNQEFFHARNQPLFRHELNATNFHSIWNQIQALTGQTSVTLEEFVAHLMIMYNETGGTLTPAIESGGAAYFFEYRIINKTTSPRRKKTYNGNDGNRSAGTELRERGIISSQEDVDLWNLGDRTGPEFEDALPITPIPGQPRPPRVPSVTQYGRYPASQPEAVRTAAMQCDFYKYRGRGLLQLTHRATYQACLDATIRQEYHGLTCDQLTSEQLDDAFQTHPVVYAAAFREYIRRIPAAVAGLAAVRNRQFAAYGDAVAGAGGTYGSNIFQPRCSRVRDRMADIGYSVGP